MIILHKLYIHRSLVDFIRQDSIEKEDDSINIKERDWPR